MTAALIVSAIAAVLAAYAFLFALCAAAARGDRVLVDVEPDDERKAA